MALGLALRAGGALAAAVVLSGCWIASVEETGTPAPVVSEEPAVTVEPEAPAPANATTFRDGRYAAYLEAVLGTELIVFDPIAFVTGNAAREIYGAEHPDEADGPPNDYLIVNTSTARWRAALAADVRIQVVAMGGPVELVDATVEQLAQHIAELPGPTPFWIVVRDGDVVAVEEQYVP